VQNLLVADDPVLISGRADVSAERCALIVEKIESLIALRDRSATQGFLLLTASDDIDTRLPRVQSLFQRHTGTCPVKVRLQLDEGEVSIVLRDSANSPVCVVPSETLCEEVEQIFGRPVLSFV
jgi:hypothetical protein